MVMFAENRDIRNRRQCKKPAKPLPPQKYIMNNINTKQGQDGKK